MDKQKTKEEALAFLASIGALDVHRELKGKEREHIVLLTKMMDPVSESNNQHSWTKVFHIGGKVYHFHYFPEADEPLIEEYIKYADK